MTRYKHIGGWATDQKLEKCTLQILHISSLSYKTPLENTGTKELPEPCSKDNQAQISPWSRICPLVWQKDISLDRAPFPGWQPQDLPTIPSMRTTDGFHDVQGSALWHKLSSLAMYVILNEAKSFIPVPPLVSVSLAEEKSLLASRKPLFAGYKNFYFLCNEVTVGFGS